MKRFVLSVGLCLLLVACQAAPTVQTKATPVPSMDVSTQISTTPTPSLTDLPNWRPVELRLSEALLQNAEYHSRDWGAYQLVDGVYYRTPAAPGESPQLYSTQITLPVFGDINDDGYQDAAVILVTYNGGNGNSKELAVLLDRDGQAVNVATLALGSLVAVDVLEIQSAVMILNVRVLGPNDAFCCPSQQETWRFQLENNQLIRLP